MFWRLCPYFLKHTISFLQSLLPIVSFWIRFGKLKTTFCANSHVLWITIIHVPIVWTMAKGWHHENLMGFSPNHRCGFFLFFKFFLLLSNVFFLLSALSCLMSYLSTILIRHGFLSPNNFFFPLLMLLLGKHRFFKWCTTLGSKIGNICCGSSTPINYLILKIFHPSFFFDQLPYHGVVEGLFNTKKFPQDNWNGL